MSDRSALGARSLAIGKEGERAAVRALRAAGFPHAARRKAGRFHDALDLDICPGLIASVKAGETAKTASLHRVIAWRTEAEEKRQADHADVCLLIVQRRGAGTSRAHLWRCWVLGLGRDTWETTLDDACTWLRLTGWGEPLTDDERIEIA